jgi:predicted nucleotidyltransferase
MDLPLSVLSSVTTTLESVGIRYVLVGSFASSIHGTYRATADIDILTELKIEQVHPLFESLRDAFYLDELTMQQAATQGGSFNAIHFDSVFKVDLFVAGSDEFSLSQLNRRDLRRLPPQSTETVYVASVEDTVLAKLRWYRTGQETSSTQWRDVIGMPVTSRDVLGPVSLVSPIY